MNHSASIRSGAKYLAAGVFSAFLWSGCGNATSEDAAPQAADSGIFTTEPDPLEVAIAQVTGENPMEGIMALRELASAEPPNVEAVLWLGKFSVQSGQLDKARERFEQVLELEPGHVEATWELAILDMESATDYVAASKAFQYCYQTDEAYANGLFFAGRCERELGNKEVAKGLFEQYLAYAPDTIVSQAVNLFINELNAELVGSND